MTPDPSPAKKLPHWIGERDYARDQAADETERILVEAEYADERRADRLAAGVDEEYAPA
jgi:hypothetical protein